MAVLLYGALVALVGAVSASAVTPVEKVITLLEDLKSEVEAEGTAEAATYDTFACFCKDTTKTKADAITAGRDSIDSLSATISVKTAEKEEKEAQLKKRQADAEAWAAELKETQVRFAKERAEYEATAADLAKAISSLASAIQSMETSKPSLISIRRIVDKTLVVAKSMKLISEPKKKAVSEMLQAKVDPDDPTYSYHSQGIIDTLNKLLEDFRAEKTTLDDEWAKAKTTFEDTISSLEGKISENALAMTQLEGDIDTLKGDIATARSDLVTAEAMLKDDQLYMKDLTTRCETRAQDWDQRSQMRADELEALSGALAVIQGSGNVTGLDAAVNKRALLQQAAPETAKASSNTTSGNAAATAAGARAPEAGLAGISRHLPVGPSFLQEAAVGSGSGRGLLRGAHAAALSTQARQDKVVMLLGNAGQRLGSTALSNLAMHLAADPFGKVKTLIQGLIERLLKEATAEATKKGFCDEELGKAKKDRGYRLADTHKLDVEIKALELKKDELETEIALLTGAISQLKSDLNETTIQRADEKAENLEIIKKSKEGLEAVKQAITILKVFYKRAAKAAVLLQASPVDEDTEGAGFSGSYAGKQERSKGVIGMLEVIASDFDRTDRHTTAAEKKAHEEFVEFDRTSRADISGKETKKELDEEDLTTTKNTIEQKMEDLQTAQNLLDSALRTLEDLKPTCIDTGMSYEDRVSKREEEITALKNALCILDTNNVEPDCGS